MIFRSKAPLRISFGGGGTDIAPYCEKYGGIALNSTINKFAYCSIIPNSTKEIVVHSLDFDITVKYDVKEKFTYDGKLDLIKATLKHMDINEGCQVYLQCDAPPGSGLGTSSTVVVALIGAIAKWKGIYMNQYVLADLAYNIERKELGIKGGYQDQYAAAFGGFNFMEFYGSEVIVNPLKIKKYIINELEYNLILCYTGNIHISSNIIKDQIDNYVSRNEEVLAAMSEMKDLVYDMKRELLKGNYDNFGALLNESWKNKKKLSKKISNPEIDELYEEALKNGALGGKLLGAGGGGYILLYCPFDKKGDIVEALKKLGGQITDWNFSFSGMQNWIV